jgi:hypothetical protein
MYTHGLWSSALNTSILEYYNAKGILLKVRPMIAGIDFSLTTGQIDTSGETDVSYQTLINSLQCQDDWGVLIAPA